MTNLMKITSLATLIVLLSGCNNTFDNLVTPTKPKVNDSIEIVDYNSIKSIPDMTNIGFEWQKVNDPKVIGYNFYRTELDKGSKELKLVKSIDNRFATHYVDKDLEPKTKYAYQISSRIEGGAESKTTDAYIVQTLPRIVPVDFFQALSNLPNRVKLLWKPHNDKRVGYYKIEKYNTLVNQWIHLSTIDNRLQVEYLDSGLDSNSSFKYRIKAFTFDHVEAAPSKVVIGKTKALPMGATNVRASNSDPKKITVSWDVSPTSDVVKYAIYRSGFKAFGYTKIKEVNTGTSIYVDNINEAGKSYYYKVIAIDKDGLESTSNIDSVQGISFNTLDSLNKKIKLS